MFHEIHSLNKSISVFTIFAKELLQSFIIHVIPKVFNIDIGEFLRLGSQLSLPLFTRLESPNKSVR